MSERILLPGTLMCLLLLSASAEKKQDANIFGVFPYLSAARLESSYALAGVEIGKILQRDVRFRNASRCKRFFKQPEQQYVDNVLIQPFWYLAAVDSGSDVVRSFLKAISSRRATEGRQ